MESMSAYFNSATAALYEIKGGENHSFFDILSKWQFFDENQNEISLEELPIYIAINEKKPINDVTLKIVSTEKKEKWIIFNAKPIIKEDGGLLGVVTTVVDISKLKTKEERYKAVANYDILTKLPNRLLLSDRMVQAIARADRKEEFVAFCLMDLDGFKQVNDTLGHSAGDKLLIEVAQRMLKVVRTEDTVARLGGDEFALVLGGLKKPEDSAKLLFRLLSAISAPYKIDGNTVKVSASIGVSIYPLDNNTSDTLLRHADQAMYKAKNSGKNRFCMFDVVSEQKIKANYKALRQIQNAITNSEFTFRYQPKVQCSTGKIIGVEALIRWEHPILGVMYPNEFLPLIENDDIMIELDDWVLREGIKQIKEWLSMGIELRVSVNISPRHFRLSNFPDKLKKIAKECDASFDELKYLEIEIVETAALESINNSKDIIFECEKLGVKFALDDFGTGFSSLIHLKELPVSSIKIDKTFVCDMLSDSEDLAIIEGVTGLACAFDMLSVAEGAESIEHILMLMEVGCDEIQGFGLARPMPKEQIPSFLDSFIPDPRWSLAATSRPSKLEFELLLAESNHKYWSDLAIDAIKNRKIKELEMLSISPSVCRFGKWYYGNGMRNLGSMEGFSQIGVIHNKIHDKVKNLYNKIVSSLHFDEEAELEDIKTLSKELLDGIDRVSAEYAKTSTKPGIGEKLLYKKLKKQGV